VNATASVTTEVILSRYVAIARFSFVSHPSPTRACFLVTLKSEGYTTGVPGEGTRACTYRRFRPVASTQR
jgi:hypothetical protein